jgi:hypothetical protein
VKSFRNFVFSNGVRNMKVVSPLWLRAGPKTRDADLQVKNDALWSVDSVHTTADGDSDLMTAAQELQGTLSRPRPTETAAARSPPAGLEDSPGAEDSPGGIWNSQRQLERQQWGQGGGFLGQNS